LHVSIAEDSVAVTSVQSAIDKGSFEASPSPEYSLHEIGHDQSAQNGPVVNAHYFEGLGEDDIRIASSMSPEEIWQGFLFWHDLGSMFVSFGSDGENDFVVSDPKVLLDFIKPLLHADPMKMLSVNKSFLSSRATEALNTETGRRTIERVLLRLGCTHAILTMSILFSGCFNFIKRFQS
jgi:hypothetical protein